MGWDELIRRANARHGVADARLAIACGIPASTYRDRVRAEGWHVPCRGTALLPGTDLTPAVRMAAALVVVGRPAALTRWSGAYAHGATRSAPTRPCVLVPASRRITRSDVEVVRTRSFPQAHLRRVRGLEVASPARVLRDLAAVTADEALLHVAVHLRRETRLSHAEVSAMVDAEASFPGRARLVRVLPALEDDGSDSGFEFQARSRLIEAGLSPDPQQPRVLVGGRWRRLDIAYGAQMIAISCHTWKYHSGRARFDDDADRWNDLTVEGGWRILQLTWTTFHLRWPRFVALLRHVLESERPAA